MVNYLTAAGDQRIGNVIFFTLRKALRINDTCRRVCNTHFYAAEKKKTINY